jgi:exopolysaccharide production protein ExoQ
LSTADDSSPRTEIHDRGSLVNPVTIGYVLLILGLFALDRDRAVRTSPALWLATVWLAICGSRPVSLWFGTGASNASPEQYLDGSPFDRAVLTGLVVLGLIVLVQRRQKVGMILRANGPVVIFLVYCGISIIWSDYPDVAFKRWIKWVGSLAMVLIVLTDENPLFAVKRWLTRAGFLLVPMSILLIKYYPELGRGYNRFTWTPYYKGVATGKNELGIVCLICGIGAVWRLLQIWRDRGPDRKSGPPIAQIVFLSMVLWLFAIANSVTSMSCFAMASILMVVTSFRAFARRSWTIHVFVLLMLAVALSGLFLDAGSGMVQAMGRDPSLTGRTEVWRSVLAMAQNPWFGTGFESFWLGPRIEELWKIHWWHPNEAHDGYIELYLNLGWIGLILFSWILVTGYRKVILAVRRTSEEGHLRLAFLYTALVYNCTESAIGAMHPVLILLLLAAMTLPGGWSQISGEHTSSAPAMLIPQTTVLHHLWMNDPRHIPHRSEPTSRGPFELQ